MGQITSETVRCIQDAFERKDPDGGFPLTSWEKTQLAMGWSEREAARGYATRLAEGIWRKHYQDVSPHWRPFDTLTGVLTQIDNMVTGLAKLPEPPKGD